MHRDLHRPRKGGTTSAKRFEARSRFGPVQGRGQDNRMAPCNGADCADEAANLLLLDPGTKHVSFTNDCDRELLVFADPQKLLQIFINLYSNARDACEVNGKITTTARIKKNGRIEIMVEDDGIGIPDHELDRIFEPFFTTKGPGAGTGLGLALVFTMMEEMQGEIDVRSTSAPDHPTGTRFLLTLNEGRYNVA